MPENPLKQAPSNNLRNINKEKSASGRYSLKENTKSTDSSTCCKQRLCCVPKKKIMVSMLLMSLKLNSLFTEKALYVAVAFI